MEPRVIRVKPGEEIRIICSEESSSNNGISSNNIDLNLNNNAIGGKRVSKNRTAKKSSGGKRAPNPYMKFASKMRPQILKENPEMKSDVVSVARKIGEKWRALSDSEKAKY